VTHKNDDNLHGTVTQLKEHPNNNNNLTFLSQFISGLLSMLYSIELKLFWLLTFPVLLVISVNVLQWNLKIILLPT